jgi:hypothetical protein
MVRSVHLLDSSALATHALSRHICIKLCVHALDRQYVHLSLWNGMAGGFVSEQ